MVSISFLFSICPETGPVDGPNDFYRSFPEATNQLGPARPDEGPEDQPFFFWCETNIIYPLVI